MADHTRSRVFPPPACGILESRHSLTFLSPLGSCRAAFPLLPHTCCSPVAHRRPHPVVFSSQVIVSPLLSFPHRCAAREHLSRFFVSPRVVQLVIKVLWKGCSSCTPILHSPCIRAFRDQSMLRAHDKWDRSRGPKSSCCTTMGATGSCVVRRASSRVSEHTVQACASSGTYANDALPNVNTEQSRYPRCPSSHLLRGCKQPETGYMCRSIPDKRVARRSW